MTDTNTEETSVPGVYVTGDVSRDVLPGRSSHRGAARRRRLPLTRRSCAATDSATAEMLAHYLLPGFGSQCSTPPRVGVPGADPRRHPRPKGRNIMAFQRARKLGADQMRQI